MDEFVECSPSGEPKDYQTATFPKIDPHLEKRTVPTDILLTMSA
jgi:hypothetical protein